MIAERTLFLVMYDITDARTLQKIAKLVQQFGYERINYSVWIGNYNPLKNPLLNESLQTLLGNEKASGSEFFVIPLGRNYLEKTKTVNGKKPEQLDYWLGKKHTLFC